MDSRSFGRTLAAAGLVLGPLLFLLDAAIDPAWADGDAAYLAEVESNRATYITAEVASTLGSLLLVAGMIGVMHLMRGPRLTLGQVAAGIVAIGFIGLTGSIAFSVVDLAMAGFDDREAMAELRGVLQDSGPYRAFWLIFSAMATVGGLVLLAIALLLRPVVPRWTPALILVAAVIWYLRGGEQVLFAGAWLLLTIAFVPLGLRVWSDTGSRRLS